MSLKMKKTVKQYDSMKAASAGMGVPIALLRAAKNAGCPAFRNGASVFVEEYQQWVKANPEGTGPTDKESWQIEKLKKDCRKLDLQYEQELGDLIPKGELKDLMASAFAPIVGAMERHLEKNVYNAMCRDVKAALTRIGLTKTGRTSKTPEVEEADSGDDDQ